MNYTFATILAQAAEEGQSPWGSQVIMFGVIIVLLWVVLIRPQRKAAKEQQERLSALKKGDKVITNAGIHGTIVYIDDKTVNVQIAEGVTIKLEKPAIVHVQKKDVAKAE